jgi:DNA repair photolyase
MQLSMFDKPETKPPSQIPGCSLIYEPKGRAREYAALACNLYAGCDHGCTYCYAPSATRKTPKQFYESTTRTGAFLRKLEIEAAKYEQAGIQARVLLCFTCDPYQHLDVKEQITRRAIQALHRHGLNVEVLTKGGRRAIRDLDLFTDQDAFASTLTCGTLEGSEKWEPHADSPGGRLATIRQFHDAGIPTWVSLEPVLYPETSLRIIEEAHPHVDVFKVGTLNYHSHAQTIDWPRFARQAVSLLTNLGYTRNHNPDALQAGQFYVKHDLAAHL